MIFKNLSKNFYLNLLFVTIIFILDRISKIYVIYLSNQNLIPEIFSSKFLNISLIWNEGIAFGLFSFDKNHLYNLLTIVILFVIIIVFIIMNKSMGIKKYSLLMILGGAIGNLYDRILYRAVPDFIDFHVGEFHWFIFNFADIFITLGVIILILLEVITTEKNYEKN